MIDKALSDFLPDKTTSYFKEFDVSNSNITISKEQVIEELKKVMDPEIPVNLYDLGLIYKIEIDPQNNISIDSVFISNTNTRNFTLNVLIRNQGIAKNDIPIAVYNNSKLINKLSTSFKRDSYHKQRRGFLSKYSNGINVAYCDNTFTLIFAGMKLSGLSYSFEDLKKLLTMW